MKLLTLKPGSEMKKLVSITLLFFTICNSFGQDIHLSQFYTNQQNLNPALSGNYEGVYRLVANYRNQWGQVGGSPLVTSIIGFNHKFFFRDDEISGGVLVVQDQFSGFNLNTSKIILGGSYKKNISGHELSGGVQAGLTMRSSDLSKQTFPNQWAYERGVFDSNIDNRENNLQESQQFFDINLGFGWTKSYGKYTPTGGIAFFHVNQPVDSYYENNNAQLSMRTVLHGSVLIKTNTALLIEPKFLMMLESKAQDALIGGNVYKPTGSDKISQLQAGLLYRDGFGRNSDAIIPVIGARYKDFDIGISYDFNVGELSNQGRAKSTFELSLVYTAPSFIPKKLTIPCDRF